MLLIMRSQIPTMNNNLYMNNVGEVIFFLFNEEWSYYIVFKLNH